MTASERMKMTEERFRAWRNRLESEQAVPLFLVGVTDEGVQGGRAVICIPPDVPVAEVLRFTEGLAAMLREALNKR